MKGQWRRATSEAAIWRNWLPLHWMVRKTGTASADHEPICAVFGAQKGFSLLASPSAVQMARASFGQLSSQTTVSSGFRFISGHLLGTQRQTDSIEHSS